MKNSKDDLLMMLLTMAILNGGHLTSFHNTSLKEFAFTTLDFISTFIFILILYKFILKPVHKWLVKIGWL